MSKNSKNAKRLKKAKELSASRQAGNKGAAKTNPQHGKKNAWWQKFPSYSAFIAGGGKSRQQSADQ